MSAGAASVVVLKQHDGVVTVEPKVEDLLASIRKAIDDEDGSGIPVHISVEEKSTITRGPIRDMRVNFDSKPAIAAPVRSAPSDIDALSTRIARKNAEQGFAAPPPPVFRAAPAQEEPPRPAVFTDIMSGNRAEPPEPEYIRRTQPTPVYDDEITDLDAEPDSQPHETVHHHANEPAPLPAHNPFAPPLQHFAPPPPPPPPPQYQQQTALVSQHAEHNTRRAFDDLSSAILSRATSERDIEDITRDMLRNYLGRWLDDNLPGLVEKLVREEIQRVARHG